MNLSIETPALLFSATSLILLAYTNRFLTIAQIVRSLKKNYDQDHNKSILIEIKNLNQRITLIRYMQLFGVLCLFLSVSAMFLLFLNYETIGIYAAKVLNKPDGLLLVNNKHPMVEPATWSAGYRLVLHGLSSEMLHALLVQAKRSSQQSTN